MSSEEKLNKAALHFYLALKTSFEPDQLQLSCEDATAAVFGVNMHRILAEASEEHEEQLESESSMESMKCMECGVGKTPQWRKGPGGCNSLCNACGLRWARHKAKKGESDDD